MKNLLFAFLLTPFFFSCKKSSTTDNASNVFTSTLSAKINNVSWTAAAATFTTDAQTNSSAITGVELSNNQLAKSISISFPTLTPQPGTYTIDPNGSDYFVMYIDNTTNPAGTYASESGQIVVSSVSNGVITGTFSGNCLNMSGGTVQSVSITNGSFSVKMQ